MLSEKLRSFVSLQFPLSPVQIFTISKHPFNIAVQSTQHPDA